MARVKRSRQMNKWGHDIHRYNRVDPVRSDGRIMWRCMLTNCRHFLVDRMVVGQLSLCNRCFEPFEMKIFNLDQKKPHCFSCTRRRKEAPAVDILANLKDILKVD